MENCLYGEELILFKQKRLQSKFEGVLWELSLLPTGEVYTDLIEKLILTMFPDGNYIEFNHSLFCAYQNSVNYEIRTQKSPNIDTIIQLLEKMHKAAKQYDAVAFENPGIYRYTAPVFNRVETNTHEWFGREGTRMCEDMREYLKDTKFDFLRNNEHFTEIYGKL